MTPEEEYEFYARSENQTPQGPARRRLKPDMTGKALTLRVTLRGSNPEVWRLVQVSPEMTLADLSGTLEDAMGWDGDHLHRFNGHGTTYWTPPEAEDEIDGFKDDSLFRVGDFLYRRRMKLQWDYDLGDYWEHDIVVASIDPMEDAPALPRCIQGGGACPPEDFGGIERYAYILNIFADESHRLHDEVVEWFGEGFNPAHFELEEADGWHSDLREIEKALREDTSTRRDEHRPEGRPISTADLVRRALDLGRRRQRTDPWSVDHADIQHAIDALVDEAAAIDGDRSQHHP